MALADGIRLVTFDGDATLWDFEATMYRALGETLEFLRRLRPDVAALLTVEGMRRLRDEAADELRPHGVSLYDVRLEGFRRALAVSDVEDESLARTLFDEYMHHRHEKIDPFPDAAPTLAALHEHFALGLVTNGNTDPAKCGLADYLDFLIYADDYPFEKPDPRIFDVALKEAACTAAETIHVGDSLEDDVAGAQAAGIRAVWLDLKREGHTGEPTPDHVIHSLSELPVLFGLTSP